MTVTTLVEAGGVLGERRFIEAAARTADRLWDVHRDPDGRLMRASNDGVATGIGVVEDHAWLGMALLALHGATGRRDSCTGPWRWRPGHGTVSAVRRAPTT